MTPQRAGRRWWMIVLLCAAALTAFTVLVQVRILGMEYISSGNQLKNHLGIFEGTNDMHWQYRVLSTWIVEGFIRTLRAVGVADPTGYGFVGARLIEGMVIFTVAAALYRRFGLGLRATLVGLSLLAWGMSHCTYDSDLSYNSYAEVCFYLIAALLLAYRRYIWIVPLMVFAALNRESSGMIIIMLAAEGVRRTPRWRIDKRIFTYVGVALLLYASIFIGLRVWRGLNPVDVARGHTMGWDYLTYNAGRMVTWLYIFATVGILPFLGAGVLRRCPPLLQRYWLVLVPFWFWFHFWGALIVETRLLLVPLAVAVVPAACFALWPADHREPRAWSAEGFGEAPLEAAGPLGA